jgi:hypothetical protein
MRRGRHAYADIRCAGEREDRLALRDVHDVAHDVRRCWRHVGAMLGPCWSHVGGCFAWLSDLLARKFACRVRLINQDFDVSRETNSGLSCT